MTATTVSSTRSSTSTMSSTTATLGGFSFGHLLKTANNRLTEKTSKSSLFDEDAEDRIPKFALNELALGKVLGRGGYCVVSEISNIELLDDKNSLPQNDMDNTIVQSRNFMSIHYLREHPDNHKKKDARYAIKTLHDKSRSDAAEFVGGLVDIMIEAKFLSVLRHPNIIHLRGAPISSDGDYFLVLDRLYDTLTKRVQVWKKQEPKGLRKKIGGAKKKKALLVEKYTVAYDLADALKYMHDKNIAYRDVKPDNIGFDVRGDVKMFDFGLAKELPGNGKSNDLYNLTGMTGSLQFMAPEVALEHPYNLKVDSYSFGILLWMIFAMEEPFFGYNAKMLLSKVVKGGSRPMVDSEWPRHLSDLMKNCWSEDIDARPNINDVCQNLRSGLSVLTDDVDNLLDMEDKTQKSIRGIKTKMNPVKV